MDDLLVPGAPAARPSRKTRPHASRKQLKGEGYAVLDKLNRGVLIIDANRVVAFANRAAVAMLGRSDRLQLRRGRLEFLVAEAQSSFEQFLGDGADAPAQRSSLVLRLKGRRDGTDYRVLVSALEDAGNATSYCVFIYEPMSGARPLPSSVLREL